MANSSIEIVILAAGLGKRMRSAVPKVLHRVCGLSLVERVARAALVFAPKRMLFVVGHGRELVGAELEGMRAADRFSGTDLAEVVQDEQHGTGHAAQLALECVSADADWVVILPGDTPLMKPETFSEMEQRMQSADAPDLLLLTGRPADAAGFGRIVRSDSGAVQAIVENRDCTPEQREIGEVNASIYAARRSFLERALPSLNSDNAQGELYLTDIVAYGVENGSSVEAIEVAQFSDVAGANSRSELSRLERIRREEIAEVLMDGGVTFEDPAAVYVDEDVSAGRDVFVGAGVHLQGACELADNVRVEGGTQIVDSKIGAGTHVKLACCIENSVLGTECAVGPFAHLRPGTVVENDVRIGNFVETKKATLAEGAKVNHLSYVGDATVHKNVNVGAGTITCNYDGTNKYQTVIEEGAFIGSNSSLVAPVTVGAGAVIGAGSAITKDVPAGALGLERAEQRVVEDWASKRKKK